MKNNTLGHQFKNNEGDLFDVYKQIDTTHYYVRFLKTGSIRMAHVSNIKNGGVRDYYKKNIGGVACKGNIKCVSPLQKKAFKRWYAMIERCYKLNDINYKAYGGNGVIVAERWLCFENFYADILQLEGFDEDKYLKGIIELDKDSKIKGNKIYSKDTCVFLSKKENRKIMPSKQWEIIAEKDNHSIPFTNLEDFCKEHKLRPGTVRKYLRLGLRYNGWKFTYKYQIKVRRITNWTEVLNAARFTMGLDDIEKEPSEKFKNNILMAEHSPIRSLIYEIEMINIPSWISQHISRHDAFAGHTVREGAADTHFVSTQRTDRTDVCRDDLGQNAPVRHKIFLNAQDLIIISRRRLCKQASYETQKVWKAIKDKIIECDPILARYMVPECIRCGFCPEAPDKSCKYVLTKRFAESLKEYRKGFLTNEDCKNGEKEL